MCRIQRIELGRWGGRFLSRPALVCQESRHIAESGVANRNVRSSRAIPRFQRTVEIGRCNWAAVTRFDSPGSLECTSAGHTPQVDNAYENE